MKRYLLLLAVLLAANVLSAQLFDYKGNRNQTYPDLYGPQESVVAMIDQVDTVNMYNDIYWMQQFIRDCASPAALTVQNFLIDRFEGLGLETYIHHHTGHIGETDTLDAGNFIAVQPGIEFPDEYIIVASHYDHPDGPGADDNASGTAGVLECARILSQHQFKRSILYIPFNGEERAMVGSYPFAEKCAREGMHIVGVFDMDMIGFWPGAEYGPLTMYSGYSYISERLFNFYQEVADMYIPDMPTCRYTDKDAYGGDHMSFNIHEYPALYIGDIEYLSQNVYYHTPNDTIGTGVNCFALAQGFVKAVIAATAELADGWIAPQDFSVTVKDDMPFLNWSESSNTSFYLVYKDDEMIGYTSETFYVDDMFLPDGYWHTYYVRPVHTDSWAGPYSIVDSILTCDQLNVPVFYDFEDGSAEGLYLNNDNWQFGFWKQRRSLKAESFTTDNILQVAETQWFTIPEDMVDVAVGFSMYKKTAGAWYPYNMNVYVEVTTDRKTWHKLAKLPASTVLSWEEYVFSLNDYKGSDYVQLRIRFESSGKGTTSSTANYIIIDDFFIDCPPDAVNESYVDNDKFNLSVSPNPTEGLVNISTGLERDYCMCVYNILGIRVLSKSSFRDGTLDLTSLPAGVYFISADNGNDRLTKRIVVK